MPRALAHLDLSVPASAAEETDGTWRYPWPAGERLCDDLDALAAVQGLAWAGLRVLDVGCGRGHLGLVAALRGACVVWSDGSAGALDAVRVVAARAGIAASTVAHPWGSAVPGGPWDLILAGDLLYRDSHLEPLARTIAGSLATGGQAWCSDPRSDPGEAWSAAVAAAGLLELRSRRTQGYTWSCLRHPASSTGG